MLQTIGNYEYPEKVTFSEALEIARKAIDEYDGKMSNKDVAEALGYKIRNPNAISGYIFRKFDDICSYNLMRRGRGFVEITDIAKEATNLFDSRKAEEGKTKAIRKMQIVMKAFTEWNGKIPPETAFPSKLEKLLDISFQEAKKHAPLLRKLFIEVFPYLKPTPETKTEIFVSDQVVGRDEVMVEKKIVSMPARVTGELRTEEYGILKIKDEVSIDIAIKILHSLRDKLSALKKKAEEKSE